MIPNTVLGGDIQSQKLKDGCRRSGVCSIVMGERLTCSGVIDVMSTTLHLSINRAYVPAPTNQPETRSARSENWTIV